MSDREQFEAAMVAAGYDKPEQGSGGGYLYQRDEDRFVGWSLATHAGAAAERVTPAMVEQLAGATAEAEAIDGNLKAIRSRLDALTSAPAEPASLRIDFKQATDLLAMFADEPNEITLTHYPKVEHHFEEGFSISAGLYAHYTDMPEEGSIYLGVSDQEAMPDSPAETPPAAGAIEVVTPLPETIEEKYALWVRLFQDKELGPIAAHEFGEVLRATQRKAAGAIDARGQEDAWPKLDKPAQVDCSFGVGVSTRLVVEAAQRRYERESANRVKTLADALNDPRPLHEQIAEIRRQERPTAEVLNTMVGASRPEAPAAAGAAQAVALTPEDYAIEHAEYMAVRAEHLLAAVQEHAAAHMAREDDGNDPDSDEDISSLNDRCERANEGVTEAMAKMRDGIHGFRKRKDRALAATPAPEPFQKALEIRIQQGWQLGGNACPVLYTDTINGEQVRRDDLWLATTAGLKGATEAVETAEIPMKPEPHDVLPPVGAEVLIHLARQDEWVKHTVCGYYVWPDLNGDEWLQRVFVRVRDSQGYLNARILRDVRRLDHSPFLPAAALKAAQPVEREDGK